MFNKNFIFAFMLIFSTFLFFNSDFYNYTILKREKKTVTQIEQTNEKVKENTTQQIDVPQKDIITKETLDSQLVIPKDSRTIIVISDLYIAKFSTYGAIATSWQIPEYKGVNKKNYDIIADSLVGIFNLQVADKNFDKELFTTTSPDTIKVTSQTSLKFTNIDSTGRYVEKLITFTKGKYDVDVELKTNYSQNEKHKFGWKSGISESEKDVDTKLADAAVSIFYGEGVDTPVDNGDTAKEVDGVIKWVSLRAKYFSGTIMADKPTDFTVNVRKIAQTSVSNNPLNFSFMYEGRFENSSIKYKAILIPNRNSLLKSYNMDLDKILFKGYSWFFKADIWFPKLCGLLISLLNWFYEKIPNYGIAILLLTLLMKIVTLPLTIKSTKSMGRMKLLAPKLKAIQEKHKGDPMGQQQAMMKMYKEEGVSPLGGAGGCLPMILQMPIFIALFVALRKSIELRGADFGFWIHDLSAPEIMVALPFSIPFFGAHLSLLNIIMAISMYFQSKQTMTGTDPNQKMMVYLMPIIMFVMFNSMPAGLLLYWSLSNILTIIQNLVIKVNPEDLLKAKTKKKSIWNKKPSYNEILKRMGKK